MAKYLVKTPIKMAPDEIAQPGDTIDLDAKAAKELLALDAIAAPAEPIKQAPTK